jgi:hypothetical protein
VILGFRRVLVLGDRMSGAVSLHMRVNMSGCNPYPLELNLVLKKRERAQYATVSRELRSNALRGTLGMRVYSAPDAPGNVNTDKSKP